MRNDQLKIGAEIDGFLRPIGLTWHSLEQKASQIILFGSRAANVAKEESDWDLLLIGEGKAVHTRYVDLVWVSPEIIRSQRWLGSELASHVAAYGHWIFGPDEWRRSVSISAAAVERKRSSIEFRFEELRKVLPSLLPAAKARHLRRLRQDIQRLALLEAGEAVPPSRYLDDAWVKQGSPPEDLQDLLAAAACRTA
jgi:Nucleotidyltransferase domain